MEQISLVTPSGLLFVFLSPMSSGVIIGVGLDLFLIFPVLRRVASDRGMCKPEPLVTLSRFLNFV